MSLIPFNYAVDAIPAEYADIPNLRPSQKSGKRPAALVPIIMDLPDEVCAQVEDSDRECNEHHVQLMLQVKQGDIAAFEEIVEIHQSAVIGTIAKMLGNASDAEDIAQQVFIRVWKSASRYQVTAKFTTWLFTITRNLVFNEMRRRKRKPVVSMDEREDDYHLTAVDEQTPHPDQQALENELSQAIDTAIQSLPEKQRLAVILRRYEDRPYEEIAEILGMSLSAVKSLLFRARTQLKENLQAYLDIDQT
ncbi:MAG: sigma-70 family RNA polymerase sigma factor [Verrucomicrobiales bacterium]|nr:sigma-70 family RNA polymerase sigma factor [Verrucomicrobiales bacterium]